jgi:hypothetical protein
VTALQFDLAELGYGPQGSLQSPNHTPTLSLFYPISPRVNSLIQTIRKILPSAITKFILMARPNHTQTVTHIPRIRPTPTIDIYVGTCNNQTRNESNHLENTEPAKQKAKINTTKPIGPTLNST